MCIFCKVMLLLVLPEPMSEHPASQSCFMQRGLNGIFWLFAPAAPAVQNVTGITEEAEVPSF